MSKEEIRKIEDVSEFQKAINEVRETKKPIKISHYYMIAEEEWNSLDMEGVDVIVGEKYDEIKPLE